MVEWLTHKKEALWVDRRFGAESGGGQEGRFDGFAYGEESDVIWKIFGLLCCMQELILTKICGSESAEMD
jgi:hypothetical protein